ncbi:uncharacterized protein NEMAJ01_1288 [Nematocida major]|uniref:uncharacterized protein n=1 Tax=Nematocida major TaxID=1912982 RepID=UPI0020073EB7|nr:uncharacterized protein NEMAJ01_1288 [Nematocida major]KAH9386392.1 hypothetical protein NEMAJ01_1288 [Nematocida major]
MSCPYRVLGVPRGCTAEELKRAYVRRVRQTHPDITKKDTAKQFVEVQSAYYVLHEDVGTGKGNREPELDSMPYMVIEVDAAADIKCRCGTVYTHTDEVGLVECMTCSHYIEIVPSAGRE